MRGSDSERLVLEKQLYLKRTLMLKLYKDVTFTGLSKS